MFPHGNLMKAGRAQCPACFFCFLAREIIRAVRTKTFSAHVRSKMTTLVRKTGLSTHARGDVVWSVSKKTGIQNHLSGKSLLTLEE